MVSGEELGAAGEVAGGAGAARALEPAAGGPGTGHHRPTHCLNCGCALEGAYCHCCGQKGDVHFTLGGLVHDIVHGVLHLDGKFVRTLPKLVWKPGELTRDYVEGKRARYISPIAFYLFTVVAMFAFVVSVGEFDPKAMTIGPDVSQIETVAQARTSVAELEKSLAEMEDANFPGAGGARTGVRMQLEATRRHLAELEAKERGEPVVEQGAASNDHAGSFWRGLTDGFGVETLSEDPKLFLYKVQTKAYKLSWLLIPLSLPFMWLLFPLSRRFGMYHHAVFVTYSISFMMLFAVLASFLFRFVGGGDWLTFAILIVPPVHMYRQLRGSYALSRLRALAKTVLLLLFSFLTLLLFTGLMLLLGTLG